MHVPDHFVLPQDHIDALLSAPFFATLVTPHEDGLQATPVPFHHEAERKVLVTHLQRINPQASTPVVGEGLVLVDRGDAYVSPRWYATNDAVPNVPTWDYVTLQVRGRVHVDASPQAALRAARALTDRFEDPEVLEAVGEDKLAKMARAIVAVEVHVDQVVGKAKMSQNRHPDDVRSVIAHFEQVGLSELAAFMREVSLPYAEARFAKIESLRRVTALKARVTSARDDGGQG
ncbi:FMN-binding negative transcriptional regulator [Schaalia sp. 19OD2882]|uniref:FMN-binding negative transcriptional regulator n=1 Tax=Schaalia sp. 19OD2882 TaxID=2794089 RepID=UPI001C1EAC7F|nr:FMN-binding negative transcriptional regulator [Schaalia sp. 19OD2882]QWW18674.1 FMN-binding negative transcriptional regulator [Schaalia sp. 19OD2882]